jgi:hypothetical protein
MIIFLPNELFTIYPKGLLMFRASLVFSIIVNLNNTRSNSTILFGIAPISYRELLVLKTADREAVGTTTGAVGVDVAG